MANFFETKIKPALLWTGTAVASIMAIAYVIVVFVLVEGFKAETLLNTTIFSVVTAIIGFCIMQMLKIQGKTFAENLPENKEIVKKYNLSKSKPKLKKLKSMNWFWLWSIISDVLTRCLMLALMSIGMVYIMVEGSGYYNLILLAVVNLLMFAGFGLLSLVSAYDYYNDNHIPYLLQKIEENQTEELEKEKEEEKKE
jgi:hypothetical protein